MADGYLLSPATADRLGEILNVTPGDKGGHVAGGGVRQVIHVRVTGTVVDPKLTKTYKGVACAYDSALQQWDEYSECYVKDPNNECLEIGKRYGAERYGIYTDGDGIEHPFFVTLGCACASCSSSSSAKSSSSSSSNSASDRSGSGGSSSGNSFCVLDDVWCQSGGVSGNKKSIRGTVTINGVSYGVTFSEGDCGGASTSSSVTSPPVSPPSPPVSPPPPSPPITPIMEMTNNASNNTGNGLSGLLKGVL